MKMISMPIHCPVCNNECSIFFEISGDKRKMFSCYKHNYCIRLSSRELKVHFLWERIIFDDIIVFYYPSSSCLEFSDRNLNTHFSFKYEGNRIVPFASKDDCRQFMQNYQIL